MSSLDKNLDEVQNLFEQNNLALALKKINKLVKNNKKNFLVFNYRGIVLTGLKKYREAVSDFEKTISLNASFADAYSNMGMAFHGLLNYKKAIFFYKKAIDLDVNALQYQLNLANLYLEYDDNQAAIDQLNNILSKDNNIEYPHQLIAEAYIRQASIDLAIEHHKKALEINTLSPLNHFLLGVDYVWIGNNDNAEFHLNKAIEMNPFYCEALHTLVRIKKFDLNHAVVKKINGLGLKENLGESDEKFIQFALSKIYHDVGDYEKSFKHLLSGNNLMKNSYVFNFNKLHNLFDNIKSSYKKNVGIKKFSIDDSVVCPIFIVGMPRSGSSLVEQILTGCSDIFGAGELSTMHSNFSKVDFASPKIEDQLLAVGKSYQIRVKQLTNKNFLTDKLLLNFYWLGFIKKIFPHCKIIHISRNPIDVCFSIYRNLFIDGALEFSYDQRDIINFYKSYENMMVFWRDFLKNDILDVSYEKLVDQPETESKKIFQYIGVPFQKKYIHINKNTRAVRTASDIQLRGGINKNSQMAWKNYSPYIQQIIEAFPDKI